MNTIKGLCLLLRSSLASVNRGFNSSFWELFSRFPWETVWKRNGKGKGKTKGKGMETLRRCCSLRTASLELASAQSTAIRQAGSSSFSPGKRAKEAKEGSGAERCQSCRQEIREVRTQLDLKLVRNGNGNKKNF